METVEEVVGHDGHAIGYTLFASSTCKRARVSIYIYIYIYIKDVGHGNRALQLGLIAARVPSIPRPLIPRDTV